MTGRGVAVQGGLALAALVATYLTWQREPELTTGEVFALDIARADLESVRYEDNEFKAWAELIRDKDANGPFVSLRTSGSDVSHIPMPSGHPAIPLKVPERRVRANEGATRLFEGFAPMRASRALGVLDAAKLKDLGLDTTKKRLVITARGNKRAFAITPAPPGGNDPYIRDEQDGRVYIVARQFLSDMQSASANLVERRMHAYRLEDMDRLVVTAKGKTKEFRATRNDNLPGVKLAPATAPDRLDDTARNWHDRIWALFPAEVMGRDEVPTEGAPASAIRIDYSARGRSLGWLELARAATPKVNESSATPPAAPPQIAYARSEFSAGWVKLPADAWALLAEGETLIARP
jgi:hypothetical protein